MNPSNDLIKDVIINIFRFLREECYGHNSVIIKTFLLGKWKK